MERLTDYDSGVVGTYHKARYEFARQFCGGKKVIDVACGSGAGTKILSEVASRVTGIDPHIPPGATDGLVRNGYIETLESSSCDAIVCFETIEHTISVDLSIKMLATALNQDGLLILSFPNGWGETEFHLHDTDGALVAAVERCFVINELYGQNRKSHIEPVKISNDQLPKYENIILVATRKTDAAVELSYEERFSLIYAECLRRQREKTGGLGFKIRALPARVRTKWKRTFGV